jgi:hypothetical protein
MSACYCPTDDDPARVYSAQLIKAARRPHTCYECQHPIGAGERYERTSALYSEGWVIACTCTRCLDARQYIEAHAPCFCWRHGCMLDDARDVVSEYGHASAGFYIGAMKRILRAEQHRRITQ